MTHPVPVRFPTETKKALKEVSRRSGLSVSDLVRISVDQSLPEMQAGKINFGDRAAKQPAKQTA